MTYVTCKTAVIRDTGGLMCGPITEIKIIIAADMLAVRVGGAPYSELFRDSETRLLSNFVIAL